MSTAPFPLPIAQPPSRRRRMVVLGLTLGVPILIVATILVIRFQSRPSTEASIATTRAIISSFAVGQTLAKQPEPAKQAFLSQAAQKLGLRPQQAQTITPEATVKACLSQNAAMLQSTVTHERDYYAKHPNEVHAMGMAMRDYCYHTYSVDASGAPMPMPMGAH